MLLMKQKVFQISLKVLSQIRRAVQPQYSLESGYLLIYFLLIHPSYKI